MTQPDLFVTKYQKHSPTSIAAAREIEASAATLRGKVYRYLQARGKVGATDQEMQEALGMDPSTQRPRRVELVERSLVEDSGDKRKTRSGRAAVVWHIREDNPWTK